MSTASAYTYRVGVARPYDHAERVEELYARMTQRLAAVGEPWVPPDLLQQGIPAYAGEEALHINFNKKRFKKPLTSFVLKITNRSRTQAPNLHPLYDDWLIAVYEELPNAESYRLLVTSVLPDFVAAFGGFEGQIENDQVLEALEEEWDVDDTEYNAQESIANVERIWGANYWSAKLCKTAFGRSPEEVVKRLHNEVAEVRTYLDGVLVIPYYDEPTAVEVRAIDDRPRLGLAR